MRFSSVFAWASRVLAAVVLVAVPLIGAARAEGACAEVVAQSRSPLLLAGYRPGVGTTEPLVGLNYLGHSSFLVTSPGGVTIVTDYNGFLRPKDAPDVVTMNHAHIVPPVAVP